MLINLRKKVTVKLLILCMKVKKRYISICSVKSLCMTVCRQDGKSKKSIKMAAI